MRIAELRSEYHRRICGEIIRLQRDGNVAYPNFADKGNRASRSIAQGIVDRLGHCVGGGTIAGQTAGGFFERVTKDFLQSTFQLLQHLRPGDWTYSTQTLISEFDQYAHLANLERIVEGNSELAAALGTDYIIKPDIVVGRLPVSDDEINRDQVVIAPNGSAARLSPFRQANSVVPRPFLHASISCKWTLRSDRGQNARTEALNLVRNRKGPLPHVVAVTAEPLPTRISSLALGTGDLDCVYHFALPELRDAIVETDNEDQLDMLDTLIQGRRLRDISDLPFDLAI